MNAPGHEGHETAAALGQVITDYGRRAGANPTRLRAMLSDALGSSSAAHRAQVDALVVAAEEGIPARILDGGAAGLPALVASLAGWGLSESMAGWAVETWALALGDAALLAAGGPATSVPATELPGTEVPGATEPALVHGHAATEAPRSRRRRGLVAAALTGLLVAGAGTAYAMSGTGAATNGAASHPRTTPIASQTSSAPADQPAGAGHMPGGDQTSTGPSAGTTSPTTGTAPAKTGTTPGRTSSSKTASKSSSKTPPSKKGSTGSTPTKSGTGTTPLGPNPQARAYTVPPFKDSLCGSGHCPHSWNLSVCTSGTWDRIVIVARPSTGSASTSGKVLTYTPSTQGPYNDSISYYVVNSKTGQKSGTATISIYVQGLWE